MKNEFLTTLKIHKLSQEQYDRELSAGNLDETALYLTPEEDLDLSGYAQISDLDTKAEIEHTHDATDINTGVLSLANGGTGQDMSARTQNAIIRFSSGGNYFSSTPTKSGAFFATTANGAPEFGTLPIAQGGTGATTEAGVRTNLNVYSKTEADNAFDAKNSATNAVSGHNVATDAHSDIRTSISNLTADVNSKVSSELLTDIQGESPSMSPVISQRFIEVETDIEGLEQNLENTNNEISELEGLLNALNESVNSRFSSIESEIQLAINSLSTI